MKLDPPKDSWHMISYKLSSHLKHIGSMIKETQGSERINNPFDLERRVEGQSDPTKVCKPHISP